MTRPYVKDVTSSHGRDMTYSDVRYDSQRPVLLLPSGCHGRQLYVSFICQTWLIWHIHMWDMTYPRVRHDRFTCETWLSTTCSIATEILSWKANSCFFFSICQIWMSCLTYERHIWKTKSCLTYERHMRDAVMVRASFHVSDTTYMTYSYVRYDWSMCGM